MFTFTLAFLYQFPASLFSKRRKEKPYLAAVILRVDPDIRSNYSSLDRLEHIFFPWLNAQCPGIHYINITNLVDRCGGAVVINNNTVKDLGGRLTSAYFYQFRFQMCYSLFHVVICGCHYLGNIFCHIRCLLYTSDAA